MSSLNDTAANESKEAIRTLQRLALNNLRRAHLLSESIVSNLHFESLNITIKTEQLGKDGHPFSPITQDIIKSTDGFVTIITNFSTQSGLFVKELLNCVHIIRYFGYMQQILHNLYNDQREIFVSTPEEFENCIYAKSVFLLTRIRFVDENADKAVRFLRVYKPYIDAVIRKQNIIAKLKSAFFDLQDISNKFFYLISTEKYASTLAKIESSRLSQENEHVQHSFSNINAFISKTQSEIEDLVSDIETMQHMIENI